MGPRILHVGPLPPPYGGVAAAMQSIIACPALSSYEHVVCNTSAGAETELVGKKQVTLSRFVRRVARVGRILRSVAAHRPDIVHYHVGSEHGLEMTADLVLPFLMRAAGARRVLVHLHCDPVTAALPGRSRIGIRFFRALTAAAAGVVTLVEGSAEHLRAIGFHRMIAVVPNMPDETVTKMEGDRTSGSGVRVLFVGRLTAAKGIFTLLETAALTKDIPNLTFEVAGLASSAADLAVLRAYVDENGLGERVIFHGTVFGDQKRRLFADANVLMVTSFAETFGIVVVEGMAAALPVIASSLSAVATIVEDGKTGFLVEPGDAVGFANRLRQLVADDQLRKKMGAAGKERFEQEFSAEAVGHLLAGAYEKVLAH